MAQTKESTFPSNDEIIDEVVKSCEELKCEDKVKVEDLVEKVDENSESDDEERTENVDEDFIDELALKDLDVQNSPEELEKRKFEASACKDRGNVLFKDKMYAEARQEYTSGLRTCPLAYSEDRAVLFANRAASKMKLELRTEAIEDCGKALELNPTYLKALLRRAVLYENDDKLDEALEDFKKVLELDPGNAEARAACMRLPSQIQERNEKLKEQMMGSLKELGNKFLRPFGLSTDNFKVEQDPNSGGYSINFNQAPK